MHNTFKEVIKYGIVGGIGAIVDAGIFYLLTSLFNVSYPFGGVVNSMFHITTANILISSFIGQFLGAVNNFILNGYFTFKVKDNKLKRFIPYLGVFFLGVIISTFSLTIMLDYLQMNEMLSKIIAMVIVAMIQFMLNKFIVFRKKAESGQEL